MELKQQTSSKVQEKEKALQTIRDNKNYNFWDGKIALQFFHNL